MPMLASDTCSLPGIGGGSAGLRMMIALPRSAPPTPMSFPSSGKWLMKLLARDDRFVFGVYRRHMKVISYLGTFDRLFGVPVTTRNWNTITAIARVLGNGGS
mgnify:CR=1 FL=1